MRAKTLTAREVVATFAIEHLPDSLARRRQLLQAVLDALPADNHTRSGARLLLLQLAEHEKDRRQLLGEFAEKIKP